MESNMSQGWRRALVWVVAWTCAASTSALVGCASSQKQDDEKQDTQQQVEAAPLWYEAVPAKQTSADGEMDRVAAMDTLLHTDTFADEQVGYEQAVSRQVEAFRVLLEQPDAAEAFASLLERGGTAGQLYALCGLYVTDRERFDKASPQYIKSDQFVRRAAGGLVWTSPVADVVGRSQLDGSGRDIVGGGYPRAFAGWGRMVEAN